MKTTGKYVCYGDADGKFCWGRIVGEATVNSPFGPKEVFILEDRMTGPHGNGVVHQTGRTTVRKEKLCVETDVVERKMGMEDLNDEELFLVVMSGRLEDSQCVNRGTLNMMKHEMGAEQIMSAAKETLNERLGTGE